MNSLIITAFLSSPVGGATDLPLDGILSAAWMRRHRPELYYSPQPPVSLDDLVEAELPLARCGSGDPWYWRASFALWPAAHADDLQYWNKRMDQREIHRVSTARAVKLDISAGRYKAYHMPVPARSALEIKWYCKGEQSEIESLLSTVFYLGKKRSQGMGEIREWRIEQTDSDTAIWRNNRPMRTIPVSDYSAQGYDLGLRTYRPPYWFAARQAVCILPDREALIWT